MCKLDKYKIPVESETDEPIIINRAVYGPSPAALVFLLTKARDQLVLCSLLDKSGQCIELVDEIDKVIKT